MQSERVISSPIHFRPITLTDRELFEQIVQPSSCRNCDMSLANIYCWQDTYHSAIAKWGESLLVRFIDDRGEVAYMQPIGECSKRDVIAALIADARALGVPLRLFGLNQEWREYLAGGSIGQFAFSQSENNSDYIYLSSDLALLPGRKYQPKRNFINRFTGRYNYRFEQINSQNIADCKAVNSEWREQKHISPLEAEQLAVGRLFDAFETLPVEGWILYADGKACAFSVGSQVNHDTFAIHVEKTNSEVEGAGAMINYLVANSLQHRYKYINREDDLGVEGLRKAKQSYYPVELLAKHSALLLTDTECEIRDLWHRVFGDDRVLIDDFLVRLYDATLCFTSKRETKVVSMLHVVPLQSEERKIAYIYAVATDEEWREKGIASQLINRALKSIDEDEYQYTVLIPSDSKTARFYTKFGFEHSGKLFDFSEFGIDYDLGTGDSNQNFAMIRRKC